MNSFLDQDLYQLTMGQIAFHRFSNIEVEYKLFARGKTAPNFWRFFTESKFRELTDYLESILSISIEEEGWLASRGYFDAHYLRFLSNFKFSPSRDLFAKFSGENVTELVAKGPFVYILFYEIFILSWLNEQFYSEQGADINIARNLLKAKISKLKVCPDIKIVEFGTRRRFSAAWQREVVERLRSNTKVLFGTSNVLLAKDFGIREIGTFSHALPMMMQGLVPVQHSQRETFKIWLREFRGKWSTALSDTFGDDKFFRDFSFELAKAYDGVRHDSGCPRAFVDRLIEHYKSFGIDPSTKYVIFSNSLTVDEALSLHSKYSGAIGRSFGIGTSLVADFGGGLAHSQIVMKMTKSHGQPVCKLSNDAGKTTCESESYLNWVREAVQT